MASQFLLNQKIVAAIQYIVLGNDSYVSDTAFDAISKSFMKGTLTEDQYISNLISSSAGQALYSGKSNLDILKGVYTTLYGSSPEDSILESILQSSDLNGAIYSVISGLLNYNGFDYTTLATQNNFDNILDAMMYKDYGTATWDVWSESLSQQEQIISAYLAIAGRSVDMSGLRGWTTSLTISNNTFDSILGRMLNSVEFQSKGAQLTGEDFIKHIFNGVYGADPTSEQISTYSALGSDKVAITNAIINDLRNSTATDNATVTNQHAFEYEIGTGLLYKTGAILTATAGGGNATGTVNTNSSHQISNAETAVLTNVQLNANAATTVNLKFADHLANLEIGGGSAATVNLSDNGVNPGVNITVDNGSITLNASSGADKVLLTTDAVVASATGKFNLGTGNDSLKWLGNGVSNGANTVSTAITANGGDGVDTISANLITKNVVMSGNAVTRTATISTNTSQFTNFEKLDLAGYIGKATVSSGSTAANHTFDFGILTGNAVSESSTTGLINNVVQAATSTIGSQGFVLSGLADQVHVINAAGGNSAQLEVTGNATAASSVDITFLQNATNHFDVNFTATSDSDINAGSLSLISSSSLLGGTALSTVNIGSGGTGNFDNVLSLTGANTQVQTINVTGDHALNLTVGTGYSNVHDINASTNTGGLNLTSNVGGTGDGILVQLLNALPLSGVTTTILNLLGLNGGYYLRVEGTSVADSFNVVGNTVVTGGTGENLYQLKSSTINSGVTISDFNSGKDTIFDTASGLTINNDTSHTAIADYGTRATDVVESLLGTLVTGIVGGVVGLLGQILGIGNNGDLTSKVGLASVVWADNSHEASNYLIIDNNNNHTLDANDSVVYLNGQTHQQLVDTLHYA
ncbi:DUF4214 domain-containing protein [Klebsiella quasipneumoniae]|uniref:beta strand repeat-containing protein n=1 Tax=Klebsiella quasipneumoniae TaxID=1463165 RepID=UPI00292B1561|nr:DUF4214 domain-containing protein [Klebsiella quasipneumoniae]MDV1504046.1 DUF4214 domain-containing protein [Klebsiella quasipneumoniae subsp. quasipneumoniae]MDV1519067.1 DUF4214 domain-containing protein [Klebsiella quasipneumoniae subsp. quasipneumoniae]MDV1556039.1 DUF4214 domain-containing protein [Klebsiella quasipneumoniae subsp. quasipneumoniae]MDV1578847.1 DUF4214 domain-containing protein [Klebsiella quasipneumoniae subsp. quasipneumoniae]MDW2622578.1 DUF4214 domain-containing pr